MIVTARPKECQLIDVCLHHSGGTSTAQNKSSLLSFRRIDWHDAAPHQPKERVVGRRSEHYAFKIGKRVIFCSLHFVDTSYEPYAGLFGRGRKNQGHTIRVIPGIEAIEQAASPQLTWSLGNPNYGHTTWKALHDAYRPTTEMHADSRYLALASLAHEPLLGGH